MARRRTLADGREQRVQRGAQIDADIAAEALDGGDAGGFVGVEAQGQQALQPLLLGADRRVGLGLDRGAQGGEVGVGRVARDGGRGRPASSAGSGSDSWNCTRAAAIMARTPELGFSWVASAFRERAERCAGVDVGQGEAVAFGQRR